MTNAFFVSSCACSLALSIAAVCVAEELSPTAEVARRFDETLRAELKLSTDDLVTPADKPTLLRRLWLDTVGYPPPLTDVEQAIASNDAINVPAIAETLLQNPDFGPNWGRYWLEVLRERSEKPRVPEWDERLAHVLEKQFNEGAPWSEIATDIVATKSQTADTFVAHDHLNPGVAASEVSRIFLGISIACAECHDHPYGPWKQRQFKEFAAYFDRTLIYPASLEMRLKERPPELSLEGVTPKFFLDGTSTSLATEDLDRRQALAARIVSKENEWFAKAFVNRICAELLGQGFYALPDDIGPQREVLAPQALELLADDFAASNYDVRRLFRIVFATETYRLDGRSHRDDSVRPFACNRIQPLRSDPFYWTLLRTLGDYEPANFDERTYDEKGNPWGPTPREEVRRLFGYGPSQDRGDVRRGVPQALALMNSAEVEAAILDPNRGPGPGGLIGRTKSNDELVRGLYVHMLGRTPTDAERLLAVEALFAAPTREDAFVDLAWALLNSAEFSHRR